MSDAFDICWIRTDVKTKVETKMASDQRKTRSKLGSQNNSRNSSRQNSPTRGVVQSLVRNENDDRWMCQICETNTGDPNVKMLECQRCRDHFCIKCIKKSETEYNIIAQSDLMWFCIACRERVERNIQIDIDIETRCKEIMENYESRISKLEADIITKCDEGQVREKVSDELKRSGSVDNRHGATNDEDDNPVSTTDIISEIEQRKAREKNFVIHGSEEMISVKTEDRVNYDRNIAENVLKICKVDFTQQDIVKVTRIGKFDKEKRKRPLVVTLNTTDQKRSLMKNLKLLKDTEHSLGEYRVSNDLTRAERENETRLYKEAKQLEEQESGEFRFKVRGPPWNRRIVKVPKEK